MNLSELEGEKKRLLKEIGSLGDMRIGSLSVRYQRCGKSPCVCDDPLHPGHGPIYSLSSAVDGKTKIKNYKPGPELTKLNHEIDAYRTFKRLSAELITASTAICELRPVNGGGGDELAGTKKKLQKLSAKRLKGR